MSFKKNLIYRVAVGTVAVPVIVYISLTGGIPILVFAVILAVIGMYELTALLPELDFLTAKITLPLAAAAVLVFVSYKYPYYAISVIFITVCLAAILTAFRGEIERLKGAVIGSSFGLFYCGVLFSFIPLLSSYEPDGGRWLAALFIIIWCADTAAYFGGVAVGKTKLSPKISPGKTVAGLWWGFGGAGVAGLALGLTLLPGTGLLFIIPVSIVLSGIGVCGDLFESALKRSAGVKDSSTLIPGHGGVLDRFDSLLFAAPALYILLELRRLVIEY